MTFDAGAERERDVQRVTKIEGHEHAQGHPVGVPEPFARAVERRLAELRALDELARHLHRSR